MPTFLHYFSEKRERETETETERRLLGAVAGTMCSVGGTGSSPASERTVHENLSSLLSMSEFQVYNI